MKQQVENEILQELRNISKLLILFFLQNKSQKECISALSDMGFQPKEIANLIKSTPGSVRVALVGIRKKKKKVKSVN
jgi:hypothetical protein